MQQSSTTAPTATGQLISTFRHGKGFLVFMLLFAIVMLGLAGFVLYLGTILPAGSSGANTSRGSSPQMLIYSVSGLLVVISAVLFGLYAWQKKLRGTHYEGRRQKLSATPDLSGTVLPLCLIPNSALKSAPPFKSVMPKASACVGLPA